MNRTRPWRLCRPDLRKGSAFPRAAEPFLFFSLSWAPLAGEAGAFPQVRAAEPPRFRSCWLLKPGN